MTKTVLVPLAAGFEEIELMSIVDVLRRANAKLLIAAVDEMAVVGSRGGKVVADRALFELQDREFDLIALPGGMPGAENLLGCELLVNMLKKQDESGRLIGAICAAPYVVLDHLNIGKGLKKTCYPSMIAKMANGVDEKVVVDKHLITSQGPGTALQFSIKLVEMLFGLEKANEIAENVLLSLS